MQFNNKTKRTYQSKETGLISEEITVNSVSKAKAEKYVMLFIEGSIPLLSKLGDAATVFGCMLNAMDGDNIVDISASRKKAIIIDYIYNKEGVVVNPKDTKVRNQAARRFSQLAKYLCDSNFVTKIDSCTYLVNPHLTAFGYNRKQGLDKMRKTYIEQITTLEVETGKTKVVLKPYFEDEALPENKGMVINEGETK